MAKLRRNLCIVLLAVGLVGSWYASFKLWERVGQISHHVYSPEVKSSLRRIPEDKLEALPRESLIVLIKSGELVRGAEHQYLLASHTSLLVTGGIANFCNLIVTVGLLWGLFMCRKSRRNADSAATKIESQ